MAAETSGRSVDDEFIANVGRIALVAAVAAVAVFAVYAFAPDVLPDWITDRIPVSQPVARQIVIGAVSAVAAVWLLVRIGRQIARQMGQRRKRFATSLTSELPKGYDPAKDCQPTRWRKGRPQRVRLKLPLGFADTTAARAALTRAIGDRVGVKVEGAWKGGGVTFTPTATKPGDQARDRGRDRTAGIGAQLFGGSCQVTKVNQWGGPDDATPIAFTLSYPLTIKDESIAFRVRCETVLGLKLGHRLKASWDPERDRVTFRPRPPMPTYVPHPGPDLCRETDQQVLPLGINEDGDVFSWDTKQDPHCLANGATNSGKTSAVRSLIAAALIKSWEVYLLDPKQVEFSGYRVGPRGGWGVKSIASRDEDMAELLIRLRTELMDVRYAEGQDKISRGVNPEWDKYPPVLIVLDEFTELVLALGDLNKAKKLTGTPEAVQAVGRMAAMARLCNMHLIVLTQRPDADKFPAGARENFTFRLSMNALSEQSARMMWQNTEWGRFLPPVKGRGMAGTFGSEPREVQFFWTPDPAFPTDQDRPLRDALMAAAEKVQAAVHASITGRDYDLGPLRPSSEANPAELVTGGELAEVELPAGAGTAETASVLAETLSRGDRILYDGTIYTVRQVEDPDDSERFKVALKPWRVTGQAAADRTLTFALADHVTRIDELSGGHEPEPDDPTPGYAPSDAGDRWWTGDRAAAFDELADELGDDSADEPSGPELRADPLPPPDSTDDRETLIARAAELVIDRKLGSAAMIRRDLLGAPPGDAAAEAEAEAIMAELEQIGIVGPAPDSPTAPRAVLADLESTGNDTSTKAKEPGVPADQEPVQAEKPAESPRHSPAPHGTDSTPDDAPGRVDRLTAGDRIKLPNRKGQRVAYTITHVAEAATPDRITLTLKPARGRERVEDLAATDQVELLTDAD